VGARLAECVGLICVDLNRRHPSLVENPEIYRAALHEAQQMYRAKLAERDAARRRTTAYEVKIKQLEIVIAQLTEWIASLPDT